MNPDQFKELMTGVMKMVESVQLRSSNLAITPNFEEFNTEKEPLVQYLARFDNFLILRGITDEIESAKLFINSAGSSIFDLIRSLAAPRDIATLKYVDIKQLLKKHAPKPNVVVEQHKFFARKQQPGESITDFIAAICKLASTCEFSCTSCHKSVSSMLLRAQLIRGVSDASVREQLLLLEKLSFEDAVAKALAIEASKVGAKSIQVESTPTSTETSNSINRISSRRPRYRSITPGRQQKNFRSQSHNSNRSQSRPRRRRPDFRNLGIDGLCIRCGYDNHRTRDCYAKNLKCNKCGKAGHVEKVCISSKLKTQEKKPKDNNAVSMYYEDQYDSDSSIVGIQKCYEECEDDIVDIRSTNTQYKDSDPYFINLLCNNRNQTFEVDSGAPYTLIPESAYKQLNILKPLQQPHKRFRSYTGQIFKPFGIVEIPVIYKSKCYDLDMYIVPNECTAALLGRTWIRRLKINLQELDEERVNLLNTIHSVCTINAEDSMKEVTIKFSKIMTPVIGKIPNVEIDLQLRPDSKPIFCKPRSLPFSLRNQVAADLANLEKCGIISKIDSCDWGTPLVVVPKPDGTLRLCADYKVTVNKCLVDDYYPIPRIDEVIHQLREARYFCKIDLYKAYLHIVVSKESAKIQAISTHIGTFAVNRLAFGIKTAPSIFHRVLDKITSSLEGIVAYFDDIIIYGQTISECKNRMIRCFQTFEANNLHVNQKKCSFFQMRIDYLGYEISYQCISKSPKKVDAILKAARPQNADDVRRLLGMVTYYARFLPNLSTLTHPLRQLLHKENKFIWSKACEEAFIKIKSELTSDKFLVPYDPNLPLCVECDASPYGVGAVLSHIVNNQERPIAFISRALTKTEQNYSQLDREALAIIFAAHKFYAYLFGRSFELITDNKALTRIFNPSNTPPITASRLLRYSMFLRAFNYRIRFKKGDENVNADFLSRAPMANGSRGAEAAFAIKVDHIEAEVIKQISTFELTAESIAKYTKSDTEIKPTLEALGKGINNVEYSINNGIVFKGLRVYIPKPLRKLVLQELHSTHIGEERAKRLARSYVFWPGIDADIKALTKSCEACALYARKPPQDNTHIWEPEKENFDRVHIDYAEFEGKNLLIIVDSKSKWVEVEIERKSPTSQTTIALLQKIFSTHGSPYVIVSDNATVFKSDDFLRFCRNYGIRQKFISPGHPQTNGQAERFVQTVKNSLKRQRVDTPRAPLAELVQHFLQRYRATPLADGKSPAEKYLGRKIRIKLDAIRPFPVEPKKKYYSKRKLNVGDRVVIIGKKNFGTVQRCLGTLHYEVKLDTGYCRKFHINQLAKTEVKQPVLKSILRKETPAENKPKITWAPNLETPCTLPQNSPTHQQSPHQTPGETTIRRGTRIRREPNRFCCN